MIWLICSRDDLRPDVREAGALEAVVDAVQEADHPRFGADWSAFFADQLPSIVEDTLELIIGRTGIEEIRQNENNRP